MTFDELKAADYKFPTVALFWGVNCAPCERLKPALRAVCADMGIRLEEFKLTDEMPAAKALGLRAVPSVVAVHKGDAKLVFSGAPVNIRELLLAAGCVPT